MIFLKIIHGRITNMKIDIESLFVCYDIVLGEDERLFLALFNLDSIKFLF